MSRTFQGCRCELIGHCHLCKEGHMKLHAYSPFKNQRLKFKITKDDISEEKELAREVFEDIVEKGETRENTKFRLFKIEYIFKIKLNIETIQIPSRSRFTQF